MNRFLKLETDQIAEAIREAFTYNDENLVPYLRNLADSIADPSYVSGIGNRLVESLERIAIALEDIGTSLKHPPVR